MTKVKIDFTTSLKQNSILCFIPIDQTIISDYDFVHNMRLLGKSDKDISSVTLHLNACGGFKNGGRLSISVRTIGGSIQTNHVQ